jgi:putative ABC transport system permease protein
VCSRFLAHFVLHAWLAQLLTTPLPPPGALPAIRDSGGLAAALRILLAAVATTVARYRRCVLRGILTEAGMPPRAWSGYAVGLVFLAGLMFWVAGEAPGRVRRRRRIRGGDVGFAGTAWHSHR